MSSKPSSNHSKFLIVVCGPTASGKTDLAISVAKAFDGQLISADSRQFYREMNIGTAKPSAEILTQHPHHFVNTLSVSDSYTAGQFEREAIQEIGKLHMESTLPIMVGGSGLFIRTVTEGLAAFPDSDSEIREELNREFSDGDFTLLQNELKEKDPDYYKVVDISNPRRVIRALEVIRTTGIPFSHYHQQTLPERSFRNIKVAIDWPRQELYDRIDQRVDIMMKEGLLDEAKILFEQRPNVAEQTVGYQELFGFFNDEYSLDEAVELIKRNSRRYAKRQLTWFRKDDEVKWFQPGAFDEVIIHVKRSLAG